MAEPKVSLRKDHQNESGESGIMIRYRAQGESSPLRVMTKVYVKEEFFNGGVISEPDAHSRSSKQKIVDGHLFKIKKIIRELQEEGFPEPTGKQVKSRLKEIEVKRKEVKEHHPVPSGSKKNKKLTPFQAFEKFITDSETGDRLTSGGKKISKGHINNYKSSLTFLKEFQKETKYKVTWETINFDFYKTLCNYCWDQKGYYDNNTGKYIKQIKTFLNYCCEEEIIPIPLYNKKWITYKEDEVDSFTLYPHEVLILDQLTPKELKGCIKGEETRNLMMLSIFTCLRVSDLMKLNKHSFREFDGSYTVDLVQTKTVGRLNSLPLPAIANKYVRKFFAGEIEPISDQYYNRNLKGLARWLIRHIQKERKSYEEKGYILNDIWFKKGHPVDTQNEELKDKVYFTRNRKRRGENVPEYIELHEAFSSHMGRRTGVTMYLIHGESAIEVMKRSGHKTMNQLLTYENIASKFIGRKYDWSAFNLDTK